MEFPDLGKRCSWPLCKTLDFLPFTCAYCNRIFCKDHFNQDLHGCESFKTEISKQSAIKSFICSAEECFGASPVEMNCQKCDKHFCLVHRYHDCFDTIENIKEKKRAWNEPKEQFAETVKNVHNIITEKIKKAIQDPKKQATALKIQLMRLKGKAEGTSSIPAKDRIYFLILLPKCLKKAPKAIFINQDWSVGRVIDSASEICKVSNKNNEFNLPKLRLFKATDGTQISSDTSTKISDLIGKNIVGNGDSLILEYVGPSEDLASFVLKDFTQYDESF